ncbi:DUF4132 domain-containing protein [Nocardia sp. NPDC056100]|uniref:DUF7737 domain-containing protein n=1 Tax=Nocardia sp. NPDC056100 TaxID=3345712 RepID=UPI0035D631FB
MSADSAELSELLAQLRAAADDRFALTLLARKIDRVYSAPADSDFFDMVDAVYDTAFPLTDPDDLIDVLDAPWRTSARRAAVAELPGFPPSRYFSRPSDHSYTVHASERAEEAMAAGDIASMRALCGSRIAWVSRVATMRMFETLHALGALDRESVTRVFLNDPEGISTTLSPGAFAAVRDHLDEIIWQATDPEYAVPMDHLPSDPLPRGLRFAVRALDFHGAPEVAAVLGRAELTAAETREFVSVLRGRDHPEQRIAFRHRLPTGTAHALLPVFELEHAEPLLRLITRVDADGVWDLADIHARVAEAGAESAHRLLDLAESEFVSAALGRNRAAVTKRFRHHALDGIAAYGLLPLNSGETALDRYLELRASAKKGAKLGPNRRHSHGAAIARALEHLAQVAGFTDAAMLEADCEARIVEDLPVGWEIGEYRARIEMNGVKAVLAVEKAGRTLKSVPSAVRADPGYAEIKTHLDQLRDQAARVRGGLIERLVATGSSLAPEQLSRLLRLPAAAAMLPDLLWRDTAGIVGFLDEVDRTGPVTAVHPAALPDLEHWQRAVMTRRIVQPVKQVFRELYVPTPAERESRTGSHRFAGHVVAGHIAAQLLSQRGWSTHGEYADFQATRRVDAVHTAGVRCDVDGYFGGGPVTVHEIVFRRGVEVADLSEVAPIGFSEVMRDLDLVVSVAGTGDYGSDACAATRAAMLAALIGALGIDRVTVDGNVAVVRGSRATYRVHLTSGSIHVQPGGYLCVVPAGFGQRRHDRLFLPFADEDAMTSVILSKVLLLAEDEKISDPSILTQLDRLAAR